MRPLSVLSAAAQWSSRARWPHRPASDEPAALAELPERECRSVYQHVPGAPHQRESERHLGGQPQHISEDEEAPLLDPKGARHQEGAGADGLDERRHHDGIAHAYGMAESDERDPGLPRAHDPAHELP